MLCLSQNYGFSVKLTHKISGFWNSGLNRLSSCKFRHKLNVSINVLFKCIPCWSVAALFDYIDFNWSRHHSLNSRKNNTAYQDWTIAKEKATAHARFYYSILTYYEDSNKLLWLLYLRRFINRIVQNKLVDVLNSFEPFWMFLIMCAFHNFF